jgi:hypothetical protein
MKKILMFIFFLLLLFFLISCQQSFDKARVETAVQKYVAVWNSVSMDSLDAITSEDFELRINPDFKPLKGRDKLKETVTKTRYAFPDFMVHEKEMIFLGDSALTVTWTITGTYKNPQDSTGYGNKTEASGFSIIFFSNGILTGEWIGYSDLTWYKNLGYDLVASKKK